MPKKDPIRALVENMYQAACDTKALDVVALDLRPLSSVADYLVIASATSNRQTKAVAYHIEEAVFKKFKRHPVGIEGMDQATWVLMDYGDVVCHIFQEEVRDFYRLENLWHDAKRLSFGKKQKK